MRKLWWHKESSWKKDEKRFWIFQCITMNQEKFQQIKDEGTNLSWESFISDMSTWAQVYVNKPLRGNTQWHPLRVQLGSAASGMDHHTVSCGQMNQCFRFCLVEIDAVCRGDQHVCDDALMLKSTQRLWSTMCCLQEDTISRDAHAQFHKTTQKPWFKYHY